MQSLIKRLEKTNKWKDMLRASCKRNHICTSLAGQLTPRQLNFLQERFFKAYETYPHSFSESWIEHEMRAFNWILIVVSAESNTNISDFRAQEWSEIFSIFNKKTELFLRYQTRRFLVQKKTKNKNWSHNENEILCNIINKYQSDKIAWNQVARALFEQSDQLYFRTAKHCREHWLNYLDPSKNRGDWTRQEDRQLLQTVEQEGKKWARIGLQFKRTQHNVKNRYNSLIAKLKKQSSCASKEQTPTSISKKIINSPVQEVKEESAMPIQVNQMNFIESGQSQNRAYRENQFHQQNIKDELDYFLEGREYVQELVQEEDNNFIANEAGLHSMWAHSPKNLTPMGISPSPFTFSMTSNYYFRNFQKSLDQLNN